MQVVRNTEQTMGPRSGHAAYARAVRRYSITYVQDFYIFNLNNFFK
jgi:hypothetical protein